ncbi:helix-turn-helix domain-containing protein [Kibdelosporangium philippinense]|uniref:Helix-turn-helix domain-containing protein n=2 Tax=Kibdelosporangium philippinense TaxID=211113 RepID=A0ABS8ZYL7_9PSEU|nr:helix-turn-helix domain-containing protein [Kibdelosporangium philippinense]MCE7011247.1 helix-turn-helix domain-containing protein [Kibdelosporangium philippinense]
MGIVIGLVMHARGSKTFREAASTLSGVTLEWVTYEYEREIRAGVERLLADKRVDGVLLGLVPYTACRDLLPADLQVTVTKPASLDLALILSRAAGRGWPMTPVSIDTFEQSIVDEVAGALDLDGTQIATLPYSPDQSATEILQFHRDHPDCYVITMRTAVARELTGRVMTAEKVVSAVRAELHELALRIESERASAQRFAAGVFFVSKQDGGVDLDKARVRLMNLLVETPEFGDAWIENRGRRGVVVFAHKVLFERITGNWVSVPALAQAEASIGLRVVAGFGVGASARNCVLLAERAAARADQEALPCGYLIEDNGLMIGPMSAAQPSLSFAYRGHPSELEAVARDAGLSAVTVARLAALERSLRGQPIAPSDLADSLGITDPSGRRLIRKLVASGLVRPDGTSQTHRKGRPTRLYQLSIDNAVDARRGTV